MILEQLQKQLHEAQLARAEVKVNTLRMLISELKNMQIQKGNTLEEVDVQTVLKRELKKRQEAAEAFAKAGREEMAAQENEEAAIIKSYLPEQLSTEELTKLVVESIKEVDAKTPADMGRVIGLVMQKASGKADGGEVSKIVKEKLV